MCATLSCKAERSESTRNKMAFTKLQFSDDNFYLVTAPKNVMVTKNTKGNRK